MKFIRDLLFPTTIHIYDDVLEPKNMQVMLNYLKKNVMKSEYVTTMKDQNNNSGVDISQTWQSLPDLYKHPKFEKLTKKIIIFSKNYLDEMNWIYSNYQITDMWATINPPNGFHRPHIHSNNVLSGVYYLKSDVSSDIIFADPRPQAHIIEPEITNFQLNNSQNWHYPSVENRVILFPSFLSHHVPVNQSNDDRISIAFNVMLKGKVGNSFEYQSADF